MSPQHVRDALDYIAAHSALSLITGLTDAEIEDLGGLPKGDE